MFWILDHRHIVSRSAGMFQKEVARRIAAPHGSKEYGILSVLGQAYYDIRYEFDIPPEAFDPPPNVWSGVISMQRREVPMADYSRLRHVVKAAFNQRRKMLSNSLKGIVWVDSTLFDTLKSLRPEQISLEQFCALSEQVQL